MFEGFYFLNNFLLTHIINKVCVCVCLWVCVYCVYMSVYVMCIKFVYVSIHVIYVFSVCTWVYVLCMWVHVSGLYVNVCGIHLFLRQLLRKNRLQKHSMDFFIVWLLTFVLSTILVSILHWKIWNSLLYRHQTFQRL